MVRVITLIVDARGLLGLLRETLTTVWDAKEKVGKEVISPQQDRLLSFCVVSGGGFRLT